MIKDTLVNVETLLVRLREHGLLLLQDKRLPDIATAVAGEPIRGSWWAHPRAHAIFACLGEIERHPDTLATTLLAGKVTFVYRRLWPAVLAVGVARAPWQRLGLSAGARELYDAVEQQGVLLASGRDAKELERRLLVHGEQLHTDAGYHELRLERWEQWAERVGAIESIEVGAARIEIEAAVRNLGGTAALLPWAGEPGFSDGRRSKIDD
jgi:hypothetical protein